MKTYIVLIFAICLSSCGVFSSNEVHILFGTVYDTENLTVKINDSIYLNSFEINNVPEFGVSDLNLIVPKRSFKISLISTSNHKTDFGNINRTIKFDTLISNKKGKYFLIELSDNKVNIIQRKKKVILD
jgi:hydrogenase maturation factor